MKKLCLSLFIAILISSCTSAPVNSNELALQNLSSLYNIGKPEILQNGSLLYTFEAIEFNGKDSVFTNPQVADQKIKGCFDQGLGLLPQDVLKEKRSVHEHNNRGYFFNAYQWKTLKEEVIVENHYIKVDSTRSIISETGFYLEAKVLITKKY